MTKIIDAAPGTGSATEPENIALQQVVALAMRAAEAGASTEAIAQQFVEAGLDHQSANELAAQVAQTLKQRTSCAPRDILWAADTWIRFGRSWARRGLIRRGYPIADVEQLLARLRLPVWAAQRERKAGIRACLWNTFVGCSIASGALLVSLVTYYLAGVTHFPRWVLFWGAAGFGVLICSASLCRLVCLVVWWRPGIRALPDDWGI